MSKELSLFIIEDPEQKKLLKAKAATVQFPLTDEEKQLIKTMKYMVKEGLDGGCAGLAAPQVGVSQRIIVYHVEEDWRAWRADLEHGVPLTVLINPSYEPINESEREIDWEGCFSVRDLRGKVYRYKTIQYDAQDEEGNPIKGIAKGFQARLLQHEIDHLNGIVVADIYDPHSPCGTPEEMKKVWEREDAELGRVRG